MHMEMPAPISSREPVMPREPGRARALLSTDDFRLLRRALAAYARTVDDTTESARINALHHRLGAYD